MRRVYVLHGWTYNLNKWQGLMDELKHQNIEPVFLKIPGLTGKSGKSWNMDEYVDWLHNELAGAKEPVILLGHSNGGRIALNFCLKYPDAVQQLILVDSAGIYHNELPLRLKRAIFGSAAKIGKKLTRSAAAKKVLYKLARESDYQDAPEHMKITMANMLDSDKSLDVKSVKVPTVIIWGSHDGVTVPADAEALQRAIVGAKLYWVEGARHSPFATHPKIVAAILEEVVL